MTAISRLLTVPQKMSHLGEEDNTVLQQLLLAFRLRYDGMEESKRFLSKMKMETADDGTNNHSKSSSSEWKIMKFDHLSKETPHDIKTDPEEEQKSLLAANEKLV